MRKTTRHALTATATAVLLTLTGVTNAHAGQADKQPLQPEKIHVPQLDLKEEKPTITPPAPLTTKKENTTLKDTTIKAQANLTETIEKTKHIKTGALNLLAETVSPVKGILTSSYAPRWGTFHSGLDIAAPLGTPIYAVKDGIVTDAGPAGGYGNWIKIRHEDGTVTLYGHMRYLDVSAGDTVAAGDKIASVGSEGFSTGPHLHFEVHKSGGSPINPAEWLRDEGVEEY